MLPRILRHDGSIPGRGDGRQPHAFHTSSPPLRTRVAGAFARDGAAGTAEPGRKLPEPPAFRPPRPHCRSCSRARCEPTLNEALCRDDLVFEAWSGLWAPAGTPKPIVDRLHAEVARILKEPDVQERFAKLGLDPSGMAPAELAAFQKAEIEKWAKVIKAANIRID